MLSDIDIDILRAMANRPVLFAINKIEECYIFILGYSLANPKKEIHSFINGKFTEFIKKNTNAIDGEWYQIIRYQSTTDIGSLELFKKYFNAFLKSLDDN